MKAWGSCPPITTRRAASPTAPARHWRSIFDDVDVLLTLSAPGAAPKGLASTGDPRFNRLWTLMGVPCVNVPGYVAEGGLPVGVQVIARFGNDAGALKAARFVEEALKRCEDAVIPGHAPSRGPGIQRSWREIPGSMLRIAPE